MLFIIFISSQPSIQTFRRNMLRLNQSPINYTISPENPSLFMLNICGLYFLANLHKFQFKNKFGKPSDTYKIRKLFTSEKLDIYYHLEVNRRTKWIIIKIFKFISILISLTMMSLHLFLYFWPFAILIVLCLFRNPSPIKLK